MISKHTVIRALLALTFSSNLFALPPQVEMDKLALGSKTNMDEHKFGSALEKLEKMKSLNAKLPDTYWYHYGTVLLEIDDPKGAIAALDKYLEQGQSAKFYKEALEKSNRAEEIEKVQYVFIDTSTKLMWQDGEIGVNMTRDNAIRYCEDSKFRGFDDWRLPSLDDLESLRSKKSYLKHLLPYLISSESDMHNNIISMEGGMVIKNDKGQVRCMRPIQ
jgi:tetratricopeptide (TPR) repeat protein